MARAASVLRQNSGAALWIAAGHDVLGTLFPRDAGNENSDENDDERADSGAAYRARGTRFAYVARS